MKRDLAAGFFFVGLGMSFGDVSPGWLRSWLMWTILAVVAASLAAYLLPNM